MTPSARRIYWLLISLCLTSVLAGCGWRLQGTTKLAPVMATTYVDTKDRFTDFNRALRESLQASGARITTDEKEATAVVKIIKDESGQRVLTVSGRNTPEEYEVFYTIEYSVNGRTEELIAPEKLELTPRLQLRRNRRAREAEGTIDSARGAGSRPGGSSRETSRRALMHG